MKRLACLALCALLLVTAVCASAAEYTLPEKLRRQLDFGNGFRGTATFALTGDAPWTQSLRSLDGAELQLRAIHSDGQFQYQLYGLEGETQVGLTQLYGDAENAYFRSELLPGKLLTMPIGDSLTSLALDKAGANPAWYDAALRLLSISDADWAESWEPALLPYQQQLEMWLDAYASAPEMVRDNEGNAVMVVRYVLPVQAIKDELVSLVRLLMADETLLTLLREQMRDNAQAVYLNPDLMYFYEAAIAALPFGEDVMVERELSTMGELVSTELRLPVLTADGNARMLSVEQGDGGLTATLEGDEQDVILILRESTRMAESMTMRGALRVIPTDMSEDHPGQSIGFAVKRLHATSTDSGSINHDSTSYTLSLAPDLTDLADGEGLYADFLPVELKVLVHLSSGSANRNPTNVEVDATFACGGATLTMNAVCKTTTPWLLFDLPTEGAESVLTGDMTSNLLTLLGNLRAALAKQTAEDLPLPVGTATDLAE